MTDPAAPYWTIEYLESGESVPGGPFTVFISEGEEDGRSLDLQCVPDEPDEQSVRLELDSYCVVSEGGGVHYGGLEAVALRPDRLLLRFTDEAVGELELPSQEVVLGIAPGIGVEELRAGLRKVLSYGNPEKVPTMSFY